MPKNHSTKLFDLIQSLSSSEKRHFKVHLQKSEKHKYALLFDAMEQAPTSDDDLFKQIIYGSAAIVSKKYSELKSYLYDLLLNSLQSFDESTSVDYFLKNNLLNIKTLYKRARYEDCRELLHKVRRVAQEHESFQHLLEVVQWENQIAYAEADINFWNTHLHRLVLEEQFYTAQTALISSLRNAFFRLLALIRQNAAHSNSEHRATLQKIIELPYLSDFEQLNSKKSQILYLRIFNIYYYSIHEYEDFYASGKKLVVAMESNPAFLREDVSEYISALSNYTYSCFLQKKYSEMEIALEKFKTIRTLTTDDETKVHRQYYQNKFAICIATGNFKEGLVALKEHLREIEKFDKNMFERSSFYYNYFYIHFGNGNFEDALDFLNQWLQLPKSVERQDLQRVARILNLITHLELGNFLLIESLLRSAHRFMDKSGSPDQLERKIMTYIRNISRSNDGRQKKSMTQNLHAFFEQEKDNKLKNNLLEYFDFAAWLQSKLQGLPFAEVVRQHYAQTL